MGTTSKRGEPTNKQYVIAAEIKGKRTRRQPTTRRRRKEDRKAKLTKRRDDAEKTKLGRGRRRDEKKRDDAFVPGPVHVHLHRRHRLPGQRVRRAAGQSQQRDVRRRERSTSRTCRTSSTPSTGCQATTASWRSAPASSPIPRCERWKCKPKTPAPETQDQIRKFLADLKERVGGDRQRAGRRHREESATSWRRRKKGSDYQQDHNG